MSQTLIDRQLFSKFSKCKLWLRELDFLCHICSGDAIRVDPKKMKVVKNCLRPLSPSDIRNFLGLAGYYRVLLQCLAFD